MKNSYQVVAGKHITGDQTFEKGDSVTSDQDLVKMYPGKFRLEGPVKEKAKKAKPLPFDLEPESLPAEENDDEVTEPETETKPLPPTKAAAPVKKKTAKASKGKDNDWDD